MLTRNGDPNTNAEEDEDEDEEDIFNVDRDRQQCCPGDHENVLVDGLCL